MSRNHRFALFPLAACLLLGAAFARARAPQPVQGWGKVVDPDGDCRVRQEQGKVTFTIPKTHHDLTYTEDYTKLNAPRVLREASGDFRLEVTVRAFPLPEKDTPSGGKFSFTSAGLLLWQDGNTFIRMERAAEGAAQSPFVWVERFQGGKSVTQQLKRVADTDTSLRVERSGNKLTFSVRPEGEGEGWTEVHTEEVTLPGKLNVGVLAINTTTREFSANLEGLKLATR